MGCIAAGCGHAPDKLAVADRLVTLIQNETPWQPSFTKNQIVFRDGAKRTASLQLWGHGVRLEAFALHDDPPRDLLGAIASRTRRGTWCWTFRDQASLPQSIIGLVALDDPDRPAAPPPA